MSISSLSFHKSVENGRKPEKEKSSSRIEKGRRSRIKSDRRRYLFNQAEYVRKLQTALAVDGVDECLSLFLSVLVSDGLVVQLATEVAGGSPVVVAHIGNQGLGNGH